MSTEEKWQTTRPTIRERAKFMLNNDHLSDVKFVALQRSRENESKKAIPAHKFVLAISSPVFEAMFYGELAETKDTIELPDCDYESLLEMFRFMYSDEVELSGSNVMGVLYLAKKYVIPSLADECTKYLQDELGPSNVFSILPVAQRYEEKGLVGRCWEVIDNEAEAAMKSDGFETIEESLLAAVVSRDTLTIEEIELFKAVDTWAIRQCEKQGLGVSGESKRRILGERIIKALRFPVMKQEEFAAVVMDTRILTPQEMLLFFKFFSSASTFPVGFSATPRRLCCVHRCCRFQAMLYGWVYGPDARDAICFAVDKDIRFRGLCLFGSENNTYNVTLTVRNSRTNSTFFSKSGSYPSKLLQCKSYSYHGLEILFDPAVELKKNDNYEVITVIGGPNSEYGNVGFSAVKESDVKFTFSRSSCSCNGTGVNQGQISEFLFCT